MRACACEGQSAGYGEFGDWVVWADGAAVALVFDMLDIGGASLSKQTPGQGLGLLG
jgi:hypothetical protein